MTIKRITRENAESAWKVFVIQAKPDDRLTLVGEHPVKKNGKIVSVKGRKAFVIPAHAAGGAKLQSYGVSDEFNEALEPERKDELIKKFEQGYLELVHDRVNGGYSLIENDFEEVEQAAGEEAPAKRAYTRRA